MKIPFTKAHGARNDFLLTWRESAPEGDYPAIAQAICDRHTGIGADGWMLVDPPRDADAEGTIELYNSDGSAAEISGNGTRCAAALLIRQGHATSVVRVRTGAGVKTLHLLQRNDRLFQFEMDMGTPELLQLRELTLSTGVREVSSIWVGNPQCAVPVENFDFDWRAMGAEIESHPAFPDRTNVSFIRAVDKHTVEVRFWERGAGETMSSGTGSTGAAFAALVRGMADWPIQVSTPAGVLSLRWEDGIRLTGPAELVGEGEFWCAAARI
jgi:diaminopimelate epimerase